MAAQAALKARGETSKSRNAMAATKAEPRGLIEHLGLNPLEVGGSRLLMVPSAAGVDANGLFHMAVFAGREWRVGAAQLADFTGAVDFGMLVINEDTNLPALRRAARTWGFGVWGIVKGQWFEHVTGAQNALVKPAIRESLIERLAPEREKIQIA